MERLELLAGAGRLANVARAERPTVKRRSCALVSRCRRKLLRHSFSSSRWAGVRPFRYHCCWTFSEFLRRGRWKRLQYSSGKPCLDALRSTQPGLDFQIRSYALRATLG